MDKSSAKRLFIVSSIFALSIGMISTVIGVTAAGFENSKSMGQYTTMKRVIFLDVSQSSNWRANSAKFAVYGWAKTNGVDDTEALTPGFLNDAFMTPIETNIYAVTVPVNCNYVIFTRHPSSGVTHPSFDYGGGKIYNQTIDLELLSDKNIFTVNNYGNGEGKFDGTWDHYIETSEDESGSEYTYDRYKDYEYDYDPD